MKRLKKIAMSREEKINALAKYLEIDPQIISVNGDYYTVNGGEHKDEEYLVLTEEESYKALQGTIENDIEDIGIFNLFNEGYIDDFIEQCANTEPFEEFWKDDYYAYAENIENEAGDKYATRLIDECVSNKVINEDEVDENGEYTGNDDLCELLSDYLVERLDGDYITEFKWEFGDDQLQKFIDNNVDIDYKKAADWVLKFDDYGSYFASYDGETIYLDDGLYAYRTN